MDRDGYPELGSTDCLVRLNLPVLVVFLSAQ